MLVPIIEAEHARIAARALRDFAEDLAAEKGTTLADALIIRRLNEAAYRIDTTEDLR